MTIEADLTRTLTTIAGQPTTVPGWADAVNRAQRRTTRRRVTITASAVVVAVLVTGAVIATRPPQQVDTTGSTSAPDRDRRARPPAPSSPVARKGTDTWLVPLDRISTPPATTGATGTPPQPVEPSRTRLGAEDPFVAAVTGLVPAGFTLKSGTRTDTAPPRFSAAFTSGAHITLTASSERITGPVAPVLMSDAEFDGAHTQTLDGTEVVIDARDPNAKVAVYLATADGRLITVGAASDAPALQAQPITVEQAKALAQAVEQIPIPD